jgi:squalene-associated FAD-dependent desaturase
MARPRPVAGGSDWPRRAVTVHVVGAGLAGLGAAIALVRAGRGHDLVLHEAAPRAGGRCRSWADPILGTDIDNGTHAVLGANHRLMIYAEAIGAANRLHWFEEGVPFFDLRTGARWTIAAPTDLLKLARLHAGSLRRDLAMALHLAAPWGPAHVADRLKMSGGCLAPLFWEPLTRAVMNAAPDRAAAAPFARALRRVIGGGRAGMRMAVARSSLDATLVAPALTRIATAGGQIRFGSRLRGLTSDSLRILDLHFTHGTEPLKPGDGVVLALPPQDLASILPMNCPPPHFAPIVNFHARIGGGAVAQPSPRMLGLVGGEAEWLLQRGPIVSVTVSAAENLVGLSAATIAERLWPDVVRGLQLPTAGQPLAWRVIKEHRATPLQDDAFQKARPTTRTRWRNLALAGDWIDTGLPCTLEGAIVSGEAACAWIIGHG